MRKSPLRTSKISPLARVPHKLRSWWAILDFLFELTVNGQKLLSVNNASAKMMPAAALDQMGEALSRLIATVVAAPRNDGDLVFAKLDIKDGYWHMLVSVGWNGTLCTSFHRRQGNWKKALSWWSCWKSKWGRASL